MSILTGKAARTLADAFIDAIAKLELDPTRSTSMRTGVIRCFVHPDGREGSAISHEFFPHGVSAATAISHARSLAGDHPHLITPLGQMNDDDVALFVEDGYRRTGAWQMMFRPLTEPLLQPGDERAVTIPDADTEARVLRAVLPDGGTGHPLRGGHAGDPAVRQRWIEDEGEPAAFGRLVLLGDHAYLGDMATASRFRRRGHAAALARRLLDDAREAGASSALLVSTEMAHALYQKMGFVEAMTVTEFRSPGA